MFTHASFAWYYLISNLFTENFKTFRLFSGDKKMTFNYVLSSFTKCYFYMEKSILLLIKNNTILLSFLNNNISFFTLFFCFRRILIEVFVSYFYLQIKRLESYARKYPRVIQMYFPFEY